MTRSLNVLPKTTEQHLIVRSDKSVITNNKSLRSTFCTIEADNWQTRSIARPLCDSRATCWSHFRERSFTGHKCSCRSAPVYEIGRKCRTHEVCDVVATIYIRIKLVSYTVQSMSWCWSLYYNNNKHDNVYGAVIMAEPLREFTRFIWWMWNGAKRPPTQDQARRLRLWVRLYRLPETTLTIAIYYYSARKLILIIHSTEGRRLSRPSWLVTYRDGLPVHRRSPIRVLTGSDVVQLRWSKPTCYH